MFSLLFAHKTRVPHLSGPGTMCFTQGRSRCGSILFSFSVRDFILFGVDKSLAQCSRTTMSPNIYTYITAVFFLFFPFPPLVRTRFVSCLFLPFVVRPLHIHPCSLLLQSPHSVSSLVVLISLSAVSQTRALSLSLWRAPNSRRRRRRHLVPIGF